MVPLLDGALAIIGLSMNSKMLQYLLFKPLANVGLI
jgi:hypothetical protein